MNCNLTDNQRKDGTLCRSMDCDLCKLERLRRENYIIKNEIKKLYITCHELTLDELEEQLRIMIKR